MRWLGGLIVLLSVSACSHLPHRVSIPSHVKSGFAPVEKDILDNGLTLLIIESHSHPVVTLDLWIDTGSANEASEVSGISHFLEHMLFKGTATYGPGEIDRVVESLGGVWNAGTSKDFTHYYMTVGSRFFEDGLNVMSDVVMNSSINAEEFEKERGVILEEYRRKDDNPPALLYDRIFSEAFRESPYQATVLGSFDSIRRLPRKKMVEYYRAYYTPDNMVLIVAGDVETERVKAEVRRAFGDFKRCKKPYTEAQRKTIRHKRVHKVIEKDLNESYLAIAWPGPSIKDDKDIFAMDILAMILGDGRSCRLYRQIREKKQLATTIGCAFPTQKHPSLLVITGVTSPGKITDLKAAIEEEIKTLRERPVKRSELSRVKKMAINGYYFATETTQGHAAILGYYYTISGDEKFERNYLNHLRKVTAADIQRVARKYLKPGSAVSVEIRPKEKAPEPVAAGGDS